MRRGNDKTKNLKQHGLNSKKPSNQRSNYKNRRRPKEVEINVDRDMVNKQDMRTAGPENDIKWYSANPQLIIDTCSIPFGKSLGTTMPKMRGVKMAGTSGGLGWALDTDAIPGIATFDFIPSIGITNNPTAPINLAARDNYAALRYSNSRNATYEAPDIMLMYICYDSAAMLLTFMKKVYGIIKVNPYQNRYYPQALLKALDVDYLNIAKNLAQFRELINISTRRLNRLAIPSDIDYMIRHQWLVANMFLDSDTSMAQTYQFNPVRFYQWAEGSAASGTANYAKLVTREGIGGGTSIWGYNDFKSAVDALLNPLLTSQTVIENMAGDILKAYGAERCVQLDMIPEDFNIYPTYSKEVLSQIENMSILTMPPKVDSLNITQSTDIGPGYLKYQPTFDDTAHPVVAYSCAQAASQKVLNFHWENPTPADVMIGTRLGVAGEFTYYRTTTTNQLKLKGKLTAVGTEIVIGVGISVIVANKDPNQIEYNDQIKQYYTQCLDVAGYALTNTYLDSTRGFAAIQQFDWHPRFDVISTSWSSFPTTEATATSEYLLGNYFGDTRDIDTYTVVENSVLESIHEVAILSLFDSPTIRDRVVRPYKSN